MNIDAQTAIKNPLKTVEKPDLLALGSIGSRPKRGLFRVGIIGTGYIANYHLEVLRTMPNVEVTSAFDTSALRLAEFCERWNITQRSTSLDKFLSNSLLDAVHILTPPPTHANVARSVLDAGVNALVEKPLVLHSDDCRELEAVARERGVVVAVNHNAVYHPAMQRLLNDVRHHRLGSIEHIVSINNLPLAQLAAGQHDHWMFQKPENILFEQATHPLSQVCELLGDVLETQVFCTGIRTLRNGNPFCDTWQIGLKCERGTAQIYLSWGKSFSESRLTAIGSDGVGHIDFDANSYSVDQRTMFLPAMDQFLRGGRFGCVKLWQSMSEFTRYAISTLRITGRRDPYYLSMKSCIEAFYQHLQDGNDYGGTSERARIVISAIEQAVIANQSTIPPSNFEGTEKPTIPPSPISDNQDSSKKPILVVGGTGFIGRHLIRALVNKGERVRVLVRRLDAVKAFAGAANIETVLGDVRDPESIEYAVQGCGTVYLLVSGAPDTWKGFEEVYLEGTKTVAEACLKNCVQQLIYTSSITAFDLGDPKKTIRETTPLDRLYEKRCYYSKAKILCEQIIQRYVKQKQLPAIVFRPGFVIGEGTPPTHLGVGEWPAPSHCISWGSSIDHPLPFVLVEDVVAALLLAHGREDLDGQSFNLIGDVRPSAREYIRILRDELKRDICLHRQSLVYWSFVEWCKWLVKAVARKPNNTRLTYHELAYRSGRSPFDTASTKETLNWHPVSELDRFIENGVRKAIRS